MLGIFFQVGFSFKNLYNHQLHFATLRATIKATHYKQQGPCHTMMAFYLHLKSILMQNKDYKNSNISPCKNIIFKKCSLKKKKPQILQDIL
jgi:hypothetical protein